MKKIFVLLCILQNVWTALSAQSVGINTDGTAPNTSSILDVKSTTKGILIPRMTTAQRLAIVPVIGLMVFDINTTSFWYYTGGEWNNMNNGWTLSGNSGTDTSTHFIGTKDSMALAIRVNDKPSGIISTDPIQNTSWGYKTFANNTFGGSNTAIGSSALFSNTIGSSNTAIGASALFRNSDGGSNTATGSLALRNNTSGASNTATGVLALVDNVTGSGNTALGYRTMFNNSSGSNNTAIGQEALQANVNTSLNTAIGYRADLGAPGVTNSVVIGANATVNASNKVRIGNTAITVIEGQVPFTNPSDGRFKFNIREDVKGLDFILQLRPITYQFDVKKFDAQMRGDLAGKKSAETGNAMEASYQKASVIRRSGFIAQEVEQAAIKTGYNFSGIIKPENDRDHYGLSYESFVVPLVKAVQELSAKLEDQTEQIKKLQRSNQELTIQLKTLRESKVQEYNKRR